MAAIVSLIWASLILYIGVRIEANYKLLMESRRPLNDRQYAELKGQIAALQDQVNRLSILRGLDTNDGEE